MSPERRYLEVVTQLNSGVVLSTHSKRPEAGLKGTALYVLM